MPVSQLQKDHLMESTGKTMTDKTDLSSALSRSVDIATHSVHEALDRVSEAARPPIDHLSDGVHHAMDRLAEAASQAADAIDAKGRALKSSQHHFSVSCNRYIREKPLTSLGVALATGFLVSWLLRKH